MTSRTNASLPPTMLLLDSKNASQIRENGSTAYFTLPEGIDTLTQSEIQSANVQLLQFQCTNSIYNISTDLRNNTLEVYVPFFTDYTLSSCTSNTLTYTIPDGHYTAQQLVDTINYLIATSTKSFEKTDKNYYNYVPADPSSQTGGSNMVGTNYLTPLYGPYSEITNTYYPLSFGAQMLSQQFYPMVNGGISSTTASPAVSYDKNTGVISFNLPNDYGNGSILTDISESSAYISTDQPFTVSSTTIFTGMILGNTLYISGTDPILAINSEIISTSPVSYTTTNSFDFSDTQLSSFGYKGYTLSSASPAALNVTGKAFTGAFYGGFSLYTTEALDVYSIIVDSAAGTSSVNIPLCSVTSSTLQTNGIYKNILSNKVAINNYGVAPIDFRGYTVTSGATTYLYSTSVIPLLATFKYQTGITQTTTVVISNTITIVSAQSLVDANSVPTGVYKYLLSASLFSNIGTSGSQAYFSLIPSYISMYAALPITNGCRAKFYSNLNNDQITDASIINDKARFFKHIYSGFYILTSNGNSGLLKTLGFPIEKAFYIPNSPSLTPYYGFGIQLQYQFSLIDKSFVIRKSPTGAGQTQFTGFNPAALDKYNYLMVQYIPKPSWIDAVQDSYKVFSILQNPTSINSQFSGNKPGINNYQITLGTSYYDNQSIYSFQPYNILDLSYPRCVYVSISGMSTNNRSSTPQSSYGSIFACVPMDQNFGNEVIYEPKQKFYNIVPNFQLQNIQIRTIDEFGNAIQWNNGSWKINIGIVWSIDLGSAGLEDVTRGRTYRPMLYNSNYDPLQTQEENQYTTQKRRRLPY